MGLPQSRHLSFTSPATEQPQITPPGFSPFFHSDKGLLLIKGCELLCQWEAKPKCNDKNQITVYFYDCLSH